ncbi:hypothetical protein BN1723_000879 [Verticillium longisporum]|uniref:Uncharacterized protein n=1 Tax=Verticillium longisporum TaxID=100787 RepID=A0A0G4NCN0_VERLO|nr:hypothetical protein BN1723_000879 [Verticillium longisporum]
MASTGEWKRLRTLDGVGLGELGEVVEERLGNAVPLLAFTQAEVNVGARQLVGVELAMSARNE